MIYTSRTYEDRQTIQKLWEAEVSIKEIAKQLKCSESTIYAEIRRGQDGTRLENQRLRYDAKLAQQRIRDGIERRGRKSLGEEVPRYE